MDPNISNHDHENDNFADDDQKIDLDDIKGKIFIGGLSWQTSEANLRYYFEKFGELSDVALMIDKRTGKPRGFGFIKMKDPTAADIVMSTEHTIDGRLVDVKRALPRDKAPGPTRYFRNFSFRFRGMNKLNRSEACKIFVGGLAPEITEKEFGDYFSKFGIVKDAVVMVDRNTGSSRGFGFVTFEAEDTVDSVMKIQHEIMGKYVEIKRAEPRDSRGGNGFDGGAGMYGGGGGMGYGGGRGGGQGMMGGGRGGPMMGGMGNNRYGGGGMMGGRGMGGDPYGGGMGGGYGSYMGAGGQQQGMRGGAGAVPGGYNRYPAGYGGAQPYGGRGGAVGGYGGMAPPAATYGYPNPGALQPPQGGMGGYYGGMAPQGMPPAANYGGYGGAAPQQPTIGAPTSGYGGAQYSPNGGRPGVSPADPGEFPGAPGAPDYRDASPGAKGYDNSAIAAGYANAAAMQMRAQQQQQQYSYGGATMAAPQGYGGAAYGMYGGVPPPQQGEASPNGGEQRMPPGAGGPEVPQQQPYGGDQNNYGAYRGQGPTAGRVDRSYRPY